MSKIKKIKSEIRILKKKYPKLKLGKIISKHTPQYRMMFLKGRLRELK